MTDPLEWGKRPENLGPPPRPLWRDPARALIGLGCVLVVLTVYQDWADGVTPGEGPVFFNGASGSGDGTILVILAGLTAIATFWRPLADATSSVVRIIPLFIGIAMGFEYGTSYRAAAAAVDDWLGSNGHASLTTALLILGLGVAAIFTGALALTLAHLARSRPGSRHTQPSEGRGPGVASTDRSADPPAGVVPRTYRVRAGRPHERRPRK